MGNTCTLEIRDEVNIRFRDLDASLRRKIGDKLKFFLPHARHTPAFKLGRWDGCVRFFDVGGRSYFHLLDEILPMVIDAGYEIKVEDHRETHVLDFERVTDQSFVHVTWPKGHPVEGQPIVLRDYQIEAINTFLDNPQSLQQIATGSGKTIITAALSQRCEKHGRTIVIVPNKDLVVQTEKDYINMGLDVGVLYGDRKEYDKTHTICTWQSLEVLRKKTKLGEAAIDIDVFLDGVICIIVDEVHRAAADVLKDLLAGVFSHVPIRWGLTGTIPESEHEAMSCRCTLGSVVGKLSSKELQDMGVLSNIDISILQLQDGVKSFTGYAQELKWLVTDPDRIHHLSSIINSYAEQSGNTLVLIDRIATGDLLAELNPDWVFLSGATKQKDRQREYEEVNDATGKVIVATYGIAAVGINIPRLFNLVMVEPGKSFVRVIQSIGRILRKASDKDYAQVIDITSNLKYSKRHLTKRKQFYKEQQFPYTVTKIDYR
jgi:superfamily II DNA or RNA helicase